MSKGRILYFAYGSNLNIRQMRRRCPGARPVSKVVLPNYELVFRGVADIVPAQGKSVQGAIYSVTAADVRSLDRYEGFRESEPLLGMYRKDKFLIRRDGRIEEVMFYAMNSRELREPSAGYFGSILEGYDDWKLDPRPLYAAAARECAQWE